MTEKQALVLLICFILIWGGFALDLIIWKIKRSKTMAKYIKAEDATPYLTKYIPSVEAVERSKIDRAIEEIEKLPSRGSVGMCKTISLTEVLDVLENIGE